MDGRLQVALNLVVQVILVAVVIVAAILARKKRFTRHCSIMRIAVFMQVLAVIVFMLIPMVSYIKYEQANTLHFIELWLHHSLGLAVIILCIIILAIRITVRYWRLALMRLAFGFWMLTMIIGLHLYTTIWLSF